MKIYKVTNLINNKIYIGQADGKNKSYKGGGKLLKKACKKYGFDNFKMETIIEGNFNNELLDSLEKHYIRLYNSQNRSKGYNLESGGRGHREHSKLKIKNSCTGLKRLDVTRERMSKSKLGIKSSEETKQKIFENSILKKKVGQFDLNNNLIETFNSAREAGRILNINYGTISTACRKNLKVSKLYKFKYLSENINTKYRKQSENTKNKIRIKNSIPINSIDIETGEIVKSYNSIREAALELKTLNTNIGNVLAGRSKTAKGFKWKYKNG